MASFLAVAGNPGVADYYDEYLQSLYEESDCTLPVVCISHAGHAPLPAGQTYDGKLSLFVCLAIVRGFVAVIYAATFLLLFTR